MEIFCRFLQTLREIWIALPAHPENVGVPPQPRQLPLGVLTGAELHLGDGLLCGNRALGHRKELLIADGLQARRPVRHAAVKQRADLLRKSLRTIAMVMALIATASMFGWLLAYLKIPAMVTTALLGISTNKIVILLLINVMCLILGCIMDMGPLILILTPILLPVATQLGMEPVQFGAMLILNLAIGLCTPPVGAALFAGCSIGRIKIEHATKACLPFYAMMILVLMLVTFVQPISMFVPHLMAAMGN